MKAVNYSKETKIINFIRKLQDFEEKKDNLIILFSYKNKIM